MKNRFFIILWLLICSTWNQSLEGITDKRKKEIIVALQDPNTDLSTLLNKDEIKNNNTIFHLLASDNDFLESFKKFYEKNPDLNHFYKTNSNGQTPLHIAIDTYNGTMASNEIAKYIIQHNVDLTKKYTAKENSIPITDIIFNRIWINSQNAIDVAFAATKNIMHLKQVDSPLNISENRLIHYFAESDKWNQGMKVLLEKLSEEAIRRINKMGKTALHVAIDNANESLKNKKLNNTNIISALIESNKFDLTEVYEVENVFGKKEKNTLFEYLGDILRIPHFKNLAVKCIIDTKKMDQPISISNKITLFHYLVHDNTLFNKYFNQVKNEFKNNIDIKDGNEKTPLFYVNSSQVLIEILKLNPNVKAMSNDSETILHHAVCCKDNLDQPNSEILEYLLEKTPINDLINQKNVNGLTAFDLVINCITQNPNNSAPYNEHINLLLQYGAEIGCAIATLKSCNKNPFIDNFINFIQTKKSQFSGSKPGPTSDALSQQLSKLNMELTNLRKKLKLCAKNLNTLKNKLGVK